MNACPTDRELSSYLSGAVSAAELHALGQHLESCSTCLGRLSYLEWVPDPLVGALRGAGRTSRDSAIRGLLGESPAVSVGQRIGPYEILGKIGEGGMGAVYRVRHERLGKVFALKLLPAGRPRNPDRTMRFEREIKAAGRLEHPHIVRATDAGEHEGSPYLAMELVEGSDLARIVRKRGPLRPADACEVVRQAALALEHAHGKGLIHRDVKPSNLLLTPDGTVKLLDLGLALAAEDSPLPRAPLGDTNTQTESNSLTATGLALGTRDYMAPEQATDPHGVDARADVYALGATLHFLLSGFPPTVPIEVSGSLKSVLKRMLAKNPADRFGSAGNVQIALARCTRGHDLVALTGLERPPSRTRWLYATVAASLLAGTALLVVTRPGSSPLSPVPPTPDTVAAAPSSPEIEVAPAPRIKPPPRLGRLPMAMEESQQLQREWASYLGQSVEEPEPAGMRTALIPPGEFELAPRYFVTVSKPYRLGTTEVTRKQFLTFVSARKYVPTSDNAALLKSLGIAFTPAKETGTWKDPGFPYTEESPITHVSRADAEAFVEWLNAQGSRRYRLPSEAEWRWACRAGAATRWPFGDDPKQLSHYARYQYNSRGFPERVGTLRPNAWGLYDMLGNVREWTVDGIEPYPEGRFVDPVRPFRGGVYQLCGGSFEGRTEYDEWNIGWRMATCDCRTSLGRLWFQCFTDSGFRICRDP